MSAGYLFPWEREAQRGLPMPEGLRLADQMAYTALRNIYDRYREKRMSRAQARAEKDQLWRVWEQAKEAEAFEKKLLDYHVRLYRASEQAMCRCRKDPTSENVLYLCDVLDGLERPDAGCAAEAFKSPGRGLEARMKNDTEKGADGPKTKACGQTEGCERNA